MNTKGIITTIMAIIVGVILTTGVLIPVIGDASTTTTSVDNEGAVGLRMDKVSSGDFTINYGLIGDDFTATNGTDTQVIDDLCIFYADNNVAVWMDDSSIIMLGKDADNKTIDEKLSDESTITITKSSVGLEITDGTITQTFPVPTWAYVPKSTGSYGFFLNETEINTGGLPIQYVGSFAGVNCYNSINSFDLPITLDAALTDSELSGARWIKQANETTPEELNPDELHIIPLDPSVINLDPEPDASIMTMPTPSFTAGEWGYDVYNGNAVIVSYSGSGGEIVIPSVVDTYDVKQIGKRTSGYTVFDNSALASNSTLTIPEGVESINSTAFKDCTNITGKIILPSTLTTMNGSAFRGCTGITELSINDGLTSISSYDFSGLTGIVNHPLILPSSLTYIGNQAFTGDTGFNGLVSFLESGTEISGSAFSNNTNIKQILNFGTYEFTTTTASLNADEIKTDIPALGYLAPSEFKETVKNDGPESVLLNVIPLLVIIGLLIATVTMFIKKQ